MADTVDLNNRDANHINAHLGAAVNFEDVIAEPDGIHSVDCIWKLAFTCFNCWKNLCYKISTFFCGICIAAEWGCELAYIAFYHVWFITPCLKVLEINCSVFEKLYTMCANCCIKPCCEACGGLFVHFNKS